MNKRNSLKVLAIIPARSGSKSVIDKNIRLIDGKPMIAYSIAHALQSQYIDRVIVSTDSEKYAEVAKQYGAEAPFLRPAEISGDKALDFDTFYHALNYLKEKENYIPDIVVHLRPTYPVRNPVDIDNMIQLLKNNPTADAIRCIAPAKETAYKMWRLQPDGTIVPILTDIYEAYNMPRQELPAIYYQNACIDIVRSEVILENHSMTGERILGYQMSHNFDIDTEEELAEAESYLKLCSGNKKFVFDIDGVIAEFRKDIDYTLAKPNNRMIKIVNKLYDYGNHIVLFTARGYKTGIDWSEVTASQMRQWGVRYHELKFGKPDADYYVDDKMLSLEKLYKYVDVLENSIEDQ